MFDQDGTDTHRPTGSEAPASRPSQGPDRECEYCGKPLFDDEATYCSTFCENHHADEERLRGIAFPPSARVATPPPGWPEGWDWRAGGNPEPLSAARQVPAGFRHDGGGERAGGIKHDDGKLPLELLPVDVLEEIAKVLKFGASKYSSNNWRGGFKYSRIFGACLRHLFAWFRGVDTDPETGLSHLAHAGCCLFFLLHFVIAKTGTDDRSENCK
jgi:hypothetical protein